MHNKKGLVPAKNMLKLVKGKKLSPIYLSTFIFSIVYGFTLTFAAIYIEQETNVNPGIFFTLIGLGCMAANLVTGTLSDRLGRAVVAYPCMVLMGVGTAVLYFLPSYLPVLYIGSVFVGFGYAGSIAPLLSWNVDVADNNIRTASLAVQESSSDLGIAAGSFIAVNYPNINRRI